jgi:capsular exopolysaccharide synthesis family protein
MNQIANIAPPTPTVIQATYAHVEDDGAREYLQHIEAVIRRKFWFIITFAVACSAIGALAIERLTPLYVSSTELVVEPAKPTSLAGLASLSSSLQQDFYTNETEASVLRSLALARRVIDELQLNQDPWFNPALRGASSPLAPLADLWTNALIKLGVAETLTAPVDPTTLAASLADVDNAVLTTYYDHLTVAASDRSRVISIKFVSPSAKQATQIANKLTEIYIREQIERRKRNQTGETAWLTNQTNEIRNKLIEGQRKLEAYRAQQGMLAMGDIDSLNRQLMDYNAQLTQAKVKRLEMEGRLREIGNVQADKLGELESFPAMMDSPILQRLNAQRIQILGKLDELRKRLRPGHPEIQATQNELDAITAPLAQETQKIVKGMTVSLRMTRDQELAMAAQVRDLRAEITERSEGEANLRTLQVELKTNSQLYETLLNRLKEATSIDERQPQADARVISTATTPVKAFFPNKPLLLGTAFALSLISAIGIAFMLDFLKAGFTNQREAESALGLPSAGVVLTVRERSKVRLRPNFVVQRNPNSAFSETIRSIRVRLSLGHAGRNPIAVLVTSSIPGEGKSFSSVMLAASYASAGHRVIVVDCDLREPSIHNYFSTRPNMGLANWLHDDLDLGEVVGTDPDSRIDFIAGAQNLQDFDPPTLLGSRRMEALIRDLKAHYDVVILDSTPVNLFSDALLLQPWTDHTLLCVRWASTARELAQNGARILKNQRNGSAMSFALTQVDPRRQDQTDHALPPIRKFSKYYAHKAKTVRSRNLLGD